MTAGISQWWYLELAADFPGLEIYTGHGWGPAQELAGIELGERVTMEEALWLPTWFYSKKRDRHSAAVGRLYAMVTERIRRGLLAPAPDHTPATPGLPAAARTRHIQGLYEILDDTRAAQAALKGSANVTLLFERLFVRLARELETLRAGRARA